MSKSIVLHGKHGDVVLVDPHGRVRVEGVPKSEWPTMLQVMGTLDKKSSRILGVEARQQSQARRVLRGGKEKR